VILLLVIAASSFLTGDFWAGIVVLLMVILVSLSFFQGARASSAAAKLQAMISVHATVLRDDKPQEVPIGQLAPDDVVQLAATE